MSTNSSDACGDFHTVSVRILPRHKELETAYSEVSWSSSSDARHPLFLLRDILQDSGIVWYVKTMLIELAGDEFYEPYMDKKTSDIVRKIPTECEDSIIKIVQACPYLDVGDREQWIKDLLSSHRHYFGSSCVHVSMPGEKLHH